MSSKSKQQHNFMEMVAHNPKVAKRVGVPQAVGEDFVQADKGKKFKQGGNMTTKKAKPFAGKESTEEEVNEAQKIKKGDLTPAQYAKKEYGEKQTYKCGGKVKKMAEGGGLGKSGRGQVNPMSIPKWLDDIGTNVGRGLSAAREADLESSRRRNASPTLGRNELDSPMVIGTPNTRAGAGRKPGIEATPTPTPTPTSTSTPTPTPTPKTAPPSMMGEDMDAAPKVTSHTTKAPVAPTKPRKKATPSKPRSSSMTPFGTSREDMEAFRASSMADRAKMEGDTPAADAGGEVPDTAMKRGGCVKKSTGGTVRGHGVESRGRTKGRYI